MNEDFKAHAERVRNDHYLHWLAVIAVCVWAGSIYGWLVGLSAFIALLVTITFTNTIILAKTGSLRGVRVNRWAWVIFAVLTIMGSSAEVYPIQS